MHYDMRTGDAVKLNVVPGATEMSSSCNSWTTSLKMTPVLQVSGYRISQCSSGKTPTQKQWTTQIWQHTDLNYVRIITQELPQHNPVGFRRSAGGTWR